MRSSFLITILAASTGCYASHVRGDDASASRDGGARRAGPTRDAGARGVESAPDASATPPPAVPGLDAGSPPPTPGSPIADGDVCDAVCDAMVEAGCPVSGCLSSCESRRERAAEIGCSDELKDTLLCLREDPCVEEREINCGEENGWPQCLRSRS